MDSPRKLRAVQLHPRQHESERLDTHTKLRKFIIFLANFCQISDSELLGIPQDAPREFHILLWSEPRAPRRPVPEALGAPIYQLRKFSLFEFASFCQLSDVLKCNIAETRTPRPFGGTVSDAQDLDAIRCNVCSTASGEDQLAIPVLRTFGERLHAGPRRIALICVQSGMVEERSKDCLALALIFNRQHSSPTR